MKKLIINSDDFGISEAYNLGVIQAFLNGGISSTTLLINAKDTEHAIKLAKQHPTLAIGQHLALSSFKSLSQHPFVSEDAVLKPQSFYRETKSFDRDAIETELRMQIELFIKKLGRKPTHFDTHHHLHQIKPIGDVILKLAEEYQVPVRDMNTSFGLSKCKIDFYGEALSFELLTNTIESLFNEEAKYHELCCHVGFIDQHLMDISSYNLPRIKEYSLVCSPEFQTYLQVNEIELTTY